MVGSGAGSDTCSRVTAGSGIGGGARPSSTASLRASNAAWRVSSPRPICSCSATTACWYFCAKVAASSAALRAVSASEDAARRAASSLSRASLAAASAYRSVPRSAREGGQGRDQGRDRSEISPRSRFSRSQFSSSGEIRGEIGAKSAPRL